MKKHLIALAIIMCTGSAFAQEYPYELKGGGEGGEGTANVTVTGGNSTFISNGSEKMEYSGKYTVRSAPPIAAPALTTTLTETCMGSSSLGVSVVGFGISGGTTWTDSRCARRLDSRDLRQAGYRGSACELMKMTEEVAEAFKRAGETCVVPVAVTVVEQVVAKPVVIETPVAATRVTE